MIKIEYEEHAYMWVISEQDLPFDNVYLFYDGETAYRFAAQLQMKGSKVYIDQYPIIDWRTT